MLNQIIEDNKYRHLNLWVIWFMVLIYPLILIPGPLPYSSGPRYIILALAAMISLVLLIKSKVPFQKPIYYLVLLFLLFGLLSVIFADDIMFAWSGSQTRFTGFSTYLFCAIMFLTATNFTNDKIEGIIKSMVICAAVVSVIALLQHYGIHFMPRNIISEGFSSSYGTLGNPNFLGTYAIFILPAAMMLYLHQKRYIWLLISGLTFGALLTSFTRGAWLGFAAIILVFVYYIIKNKELRQRYFYLVTVFIAVFLILNLTGQGDLSDRASTIPTEVSTVNEYTGTSASIRIFVWQESLSIIADNWAFGVGPDNLKIPVPRGYVEDKAFNIFLEIAATMGLFALLAYIAILYMCIRKFNGWIKTMLVFMILAYIFQGQFNMDVVANLPLFWIVLGLTQVNGSKSLDVSNSNSIDQQKQKSEKRSNTYLYIMVTAIVVFALFMVFLFVVPRQGVIEIDNYGTYEGQYRGFKTFHGQGELTLISGVIYRGGFKYSQFHGVGTIVYPNGSSYVGEFKEGYFHGEGKFVFPDGRFQEGVWERGIFVSK